MEAGQDNVLACLKLVLNLSLTACFARSCDDESYDKAVSELAFRR